MKQWIHCHTHAKALEMERVNANVLHSFVVHNSRCAISVRPFTVITYIFSGDPNYGHKLCSARSFLLYCCVHFSFYRVIKTDLLRGTNAVSSFCFIYSRSMHHIHFNWLIFHISLLSNYGGIFRWIRAFIMTVVKYACIVLSLSLALCEWVRLCERFVMCDERTSCDRIQYFTSSNAQSQ